MIIMIGITVGQIHRQNGQQNRSRYCPLTFRTVQNTHLWEAQKERMTVKHHTAMRLYPTSLHVVFHRDCHTACGGDYQTLSLVQGQSWCGTFSQTWSVSKMFVFLAIITQMGQFYIPFCSNMMRWNRYVHILQFLVFADNRNGVDRIEDNYDRLCKIQDIFEILIRMSSKFYNPSENLPTDKMIVLFKGRVIFRQYIPRKHKCFDIKIYKLCGLSGYT